MEPSVAGRVAVVIATRNRRASLVRTLARIDALAERPAVVVVDNASSDGTPALVRRAFPSVRVLSLGEKRRTARANEWCSRGDGTVRRVQRR
ncbi:MAG: glycosyltransferase [Actinomycetota bacterium]|nr:glycosyltransferase [Actinomycetota bacterium]